MYALRKTSTCSPILVISSRTTSSSNPTEDETMGTGRTFVFSLRRRKKGLRVGFSSTGVVAGGDSAKSRESIAERSLFRENSEETST